MTPWTITICEGPHDQAALVSLAICAGWRIEGTAPGSLPEALQKAYPRPKLTAAKAYRLEGTPDCLEKNGRFLVIRHLQGLNAVLGNTATDLLEQLKPDAVGVIVDANSSGVEDRLRSFQGHFGQLYPHAKRVKAGSVLPGEPKLGFWVAPDNCSHGRLDDVLLQVIRTTRPKLAHEATQFITSLKPDVPGELLKHENKAILGAAGQVDSPGASLAVALRRNHCWLGDSAPAIPALRGLIGFIDTLSAL